MTLVITYDAGLLDRLAVTFSYLACSLVRPIRLAGSSFSRCDVIGGPLRGYLRVCSHSKQQVY